MPDIAPLSLKPGLTRPDRERLAELSAEIFRESGALTRSVPAESTRASLARLLSGMNSYYSNLIEGVKTRPVEVEAALRDDFSDQPRDRDRQHLAIAHIETEQAMRERIASLEGSIPLTVHTPAWIQWLHAEFYGHLPEHLRATITKSGNSLAITPGALRDRGVTVGRHIAPDPEDLRDILAQFSMHFASEDWLATDRLVAAAASHHRLAWIHPFLDGNGRVARLYSHSALIGAGIDGGGLWSLSRGLARHRQKYYEALAAADETEPYENRQRLSEAGLGEFSRYFLTILLDQIQFMSGLLELPKLTKRIQAWVQYELAPKKHGEPLTRLLLALFIEGEISRGEVRRITGLGDTAAREVINLAFEHRLITSPSPKGQIAIAFPTHVLDAWLPRLYLDLPV